MWTSIDAAMQSGLTEPVSLGQSTAWRSDPAAPPTRMWVSVDWISQQSLIYMHEKEKDMQLSAYPTWPQSQAMIRGYSTAKQPRPPWLRGQ